MAILFAVTISHAVFADINEDLINASRNGEEEKVISLINAGVDVNVVDINGSTAIMVASEYGHTNIITLLFAAGTEIKSVLNDSSVRIRDKPTTNNSRTIGSLNKGDRVVILGKSRNEEVISSMTAPWYKIRTDAGTIGYSYGYFFDVDVRELMAVPTFYINAKYGFGLSFPGTWNEWITDEKMINYEYFGVSPVPAVYFGLPDQKDIFVVVIYTREQWNQLSEVEPPDGVTGYPIANNNRFLFDYSVGHYAANDEMFKRRGEVQHIMKTIEVTDVSSDSSGQ